jgi:hypothetical protein
MKVWKNHTTYQMTRISTSDLCSFSWLAIFLLKKRWSLHKKNSKVFELDGFMEQIFNKLSISLFATQWKVEEEGKDLEHHKL